MESEVHIDGHKVQNLLILTEKGFWCKINKN